ncbi:hypothetical protein GCM10011609_29150 [Lentzea pudingi]|uniref:Uncharacterized protein n=1 Tax=Lentzea pudingi TaxID=1789439 RepID=A0ABQ2HUP5_9PSEU|nr:hypothetical protein [Lentzea pudingi]GGM90360.1 hypothetical protein GCM10011609_29150 [Lentzea pudingi]
MKAAADDGHLVDDPRFAYELKLDGYRAIMRVAPNPARDVCSSCVRREAGMR